MPKSCIPGYDEALAQERRIREEAFLGVNPRICGIEIQNVTPFLLARLNLIQSPFLIGGNPSHGQIIQFLWVLSSSFSTDSEQRDCFIENTTKLLADRWTEAEIAIDEFIRDTFLDSPRGDGGECVPYVTGIAWLIYSMARDPFRWTRDQTLHTPLREIYQLVRCHRLDNRGILFNEISDNVKARFLDELNAKQPARGGLS